MKILIDIGHPAHVHLFKNFAWQMQKKGHEIIFTVRDKENEVYLLKTYGFNFKSFGKHYKSLLGKISGLLLFNMKMLATALSFNPDIFLSHGSLYAAQIAWFLRKPHISMEDTGNMEQVYLYRPFTKAILTPLTLAKNLGSKQIKLSTYHELAYLKPQYFLKSKAVFKLLNIQLEEKYCVIRIVSWNATHDSGKNGLSESELNGIVTYLSSKMRVFISSEKEISTNLIKYKLIIPPEIIHDVLAFSSLVISEGATLAAEAGFLGIPTIYINPQQTCNNKELEDNGCVFIYKDGCGVLEKIKEIINDSKINSIIKVNSAKLINEKIDLTAFLIWFIENYPESEERMKKDPEYQSRFKNRIN
jgi:uncharacterized protein